MSAEYYPGGIHVTITELPNTDIRKQVALAIVQMYGIPDARDAIDEVEIDKEDPRVAIVSTCSHGYYALAQRVSEYVMGTCFGDEDDGVDKQWRQILGWKNRKY